MKLLKPILLGAALALLASAAYAGDTTVALPVGDWIGWSLDAIQKLLIATATGAVGFAGLHLSPVLANLMRQYLTKQVIEQAVHYGIGAIKGATHGETLDIDVASRVVAEAAKYIVASAPALAKKFDATLEPKIFAQLSSMGLLHPDATARATGSEVSIKLKSK
jgi:hypothetical protein